MAIETKYADTPFPLDIDAENESLLPTTARNYRTVGGMVLMTFVLLAAAMEMVKRKPSDDADH